jgi:hypothetical protein
MIHQHSLGSVSTGATETAPGGEESGVRVSQPVLDKMRRLDTRQSALVAKAILAIPEDGKPIPLNVPGDPPGTTYYGIDPGARVPAVIYRAALPDEEGRWLVTALMDRQAFRMYSSGLSDNTVVQGVAGVVAAGTISASEYLSRKK